MTKLYFMLLLCTVSAVHAQTPLVGIGDSIGEGVQSLDANEFTQPHGYLNLIAKQMGAPFALPLIKTSLICSIESTAGRSRINPLVQSPNLAVSGVNTTTFLNNASGSPIDDETDLVLSPRTGTQLSIAASLHPQLIICWIGSDDVLETAISFDRLDATQITPVSVFTSNYDQITTALGATGAHIVFANIPDVTQTGFLFNRQDLIRFLGSDFGLPDGSYTTLVAMLLIKLGINDGSILQDPNWVLDASEIQTIHTATVAFNQIIAARAAQLNAPVVDIFTLFNYLGQHPVNLGGVILTNRYMGGTLSLDGVHPSNIGYALIADVFIQTINSFYGTSIPLIGPVALFETMLGDPFVDFNGDLRVRGRFGAGLLETLAPFLGLSGDFQDARPPAKIDKALGQQFMQQYFTLMGKDPNTPWTDADAIGALRNVFHSGK